jgi:hypothetical protein
MADRTAHHLAELVSHVFPPLPCDAAARTMGSGSAGSQLVTLKRRDGDRFLAAWAFVAPMPGEDVEVYVIRGEAVYSLAARITGIDRGTSRFLTVTELRRKTQRRSSPRALADDLVLVTHDGDVDATLIDVSAHGVAFLLDRPLPVDATIQAVINFHGSVIPTTAQARNMKLPATRSTASAAPSSRSATSIESCLTEMPTPARPTVAVPPSGPPTNWASNTASADAA